MNPDLDQMSKDQLTAEIKRLRHAICEHRLAQAGHSELTCPAPMLWSMVPETTGPDPQPDAPAAPSLVGRLASIFKKGPLPSSLRK